MATAIEGLERDVKIMSAMASEMDAYLNSEVLFWHMSTSRMPTLTLGGYLMRQHRLLILQNLLNDATRTALATAVHQYNGALVEKIFRFEQKAHLELDARLRQWGEYLKDVDRGVASKTSNYRTAVETRAMITAISEQLQLAPYNLDKRIPAQCELMDNHLKQVWKAGVFVWFDEWQTAYSREEYWWLYGLPRDK